MKGTPKIEKEVSNLRGTGNRMTPRMTPSAKSRPLILIIYTSGRPSGEGKLASHSCREAEVVRRSLVMRNPVSGGSSGTDGNGADVEDLCVEEEGPEHPREGPGGPGTKDGAAKRKPPASPPGCGSCELWREPFV